MVDEVPRDPRYSGDLKPYEMELLKDGGYITFESHREPASFDVEYFALRLLPRAMREIEAWPSDVSTAAEVLLAAFAAAEEAASDPETKGRLRRATEGLLGIGRDLLVEIAATAATKTMGVSS